ncbi:MAG: dihydrofolate reductase family protein [Ferruginibacter sp.]
MRKLKLQVQMSIDGFIAGLNGEMNFMVWDWDDNLKDYVSEITDSVDCILLGRKLAEGFIPYWAAVAINADDPQVVAGKKFTETTKVVFSKTLESSAPAENGWNNTVVTSGDLIEEVIKLKNEDGNDIIVYGGANFVSALIKEGLIDELHLFINPSAIGNGMPIFKDLTGNQAMNLIKASSFDCGIVVLKYEPKRS